MKRFALPLIASGLIWIAIAEIFSDNLFLGLNTLLGAAYVLFAPWLNATVKIPPEAPSVDALTVPVPHAGACGAVPAQPGA